MSASDNKALVTKFLAKFGEGDPYAALDMLSDDGRWWLAGKPEDFALAGYHSRDEMREILKSLESLMPGGMDLRLIALTAEGDRVAAEVESFAETVSERQYRNQYHMLFIFENGKITELKEYSDTAHTISLFAP